MKVTDSIYLFSSNSEIKYVVDILEALALPRNFVHHFRYRLKWVEPTLRQKLPTTTLDSKNPLVGLNVVVCYLYQEQQNGKREWKSMYAVRRGSIIDCYKSGPNDLDVAHFYFQLTDYYDYSDRNSEAATGFQRLVEEASGSRRLGNKFYSILGESASLPVASLTADESAFHLLAESMRLDHFRSDDVANQKQYLPAFCFIHGIVVSEKGNNPRPLLDRITQKTYYELVEGSKYVFQVSYHFPGGFQPGPGSEITLHTHGDYFASSQADHILVASPYDKESLLVVPHRSTRRVWASLDFKTSIKASAGSASEVIDVIRSFLVIIKPRRVRKLLAAVSWLGTSGLAVGTAGVAIWAVTKTDALLYLSVAGYAVSAVVNLVTRILDF